MQSRLNTYRHVISGLFNVMLVLFLGSCDRGLPNEGKVVFTQLPANSITNEQVGSIENKYANSMKIAIAEIGEGLQNIEVLTTEFSSSRSPEISFDGVTMVFSAQKREEDPWQIWTMTLESKEVFQVTESRTNCTDPTWLPNGNIAFSKLVTDDNALKYHALYTIGADGCCEQRITFQPHEDINASVLHDGRILVASKQVFPEKDVFKYLALRPDGTKAEVFYVSDASSDILGKAVEFQKKVLFTESSAITAVRFNRPLHSKEIVINQAPALSNALCAMDDENMLISTKKTHELTFGIALVNVTNPAQEDFYYHDSEYHIIESVLVKERQVPRKLPSRVNTKLNSGFFFSMNTDASDIKAEGKTAKVQVLGMNDVIGETSVAEDGSFYVELTADRPVRFQTLDEKGQILRGPSSWMWIRPNERRGCAGCHQDREITPDNVVPKAMEKAPFAMIR